jgi:Pre-toxin TG
MNDAQRGQAYTFNFCHCQESRNRVPRFPDAAFASGGAQSQASWPQANDAAVLAFTVAESSANAAGQLDQAALTAADYQQTADTYAAAMAALATAHPSPWSKLAAAAAAADQVFDDQACAAWLTDQTSKITTASRAEIDQATADARYADGQAAATRQGALATAATAQATATGKTLAALAAVQAGVAAGNYPAPWLSPAAPSRNAAYQIASLSARDYLVSSTVTDARTGLLTDVYHSPWGGWWGGSADQLYSDGVGAKNWSGLTVAHSRTIWSGGWYNGLNQAWSRFDGTIFTGINPASQDFVTTLCQSIKGTFDYYGNSIENLGVGTGNMVTAYVASLFGSTVKGVGSLLAMSARSNLDPVGTVKGIVEGVADEVKTCYNLGTTQGLWAVGAELTGMRYLGEAIAGYDMVTGEKIDPWERSSKGFVRLGNALLIVAGGAKLLGLGPAAEGGLAAEEAAASKLNAPGARSNVLARYGGAEQRQALLNRIQETGSLSEAKGVVNAFREIVCGHIFWQR